MTSRSFEAAEERAVIIRWLLDEAERIVALDSPSLFARNLYRALAMEIAAGHHYLAEGEAPP